VRWADYTGSGDIWSWKGGIDAAFTPSIRLRGTYSHDTRAANIAERFDRTGAFTAPVNDRISPLPPPPWSNPTAVTTVQGGNPEVNPETANTVTVGLVFTPEFLPGFDMSIDWLRVELKDAIEQLAAQQVIDQCYLNGDQEQCAKIFRDPTTTAILYIPQIYENLSLATTEAVDAEIGYTRAINLLGGNERFSARLIGSYLIENSTTSAAGVKTDQTGSVAFNLQQTKVNLLTTYINGPFSWNISGRYIGGGKLNTLWNTVRPQTGAIYWDVADNDVGAVIYWDTRIGYNLDIGGGRVELFANVQNLTDKDPPIIRGDNISTQVSGGYDRMGRRYVVGFNLEF
jgi:outer membrane receptor protein involved in Fe transport